MKCLNPTSSQIAAAALAGTLLSACATEPRYYANDPYAAPIRTNAMYDRDIYSDPSPYDAPESWGPDRYKGVAGARYAHQVLNDYQAERVDGDCERVVMVTRGDTLSDIAEYCDTTVAALISANGNIYNPRTLRVGERLVVPNVRGTVYEGTNLYRTASYRPAAAPAPVRADRTDLYVVRPGDTLAEIASRYGTTTRELMQLNPYVQPYSLDIGERLRVPDYAAFSSPRVPDVVTPTPRTARRQQVLPAQTVTPAPATQQAPVIIYVGNSAAPASLPQQRQTVITVDTDETVAPVTRTRSVQTPHLEVAPNPILRTGADVRFEAGLPSPQMADRFSDLGTACMTTVGGEAKIYRVSATLSGPDCGPGKPVRLYRSANLPR